MGRREVIEIECDRCGRVQTQGKSDVYEGEGPEFEFNLRGEKVMYQDLCRSCRNTVTNYVKRITKVSPEERPKEKPGKVPEVTQEPSREPEGRKDSKVVGPRDRIREAHTT